MSDSAHYATAPRDRIPFPLKLIYGLGAFVNNTLAAAIGGMIIVLNLGLGLSPALVGLLGALPRLTDAITDRLPLQADRGIEPQEHHMTGPHAVDGDVVERPDLVEIDTPATGLIGERRVGGTIRDDPGAAIQGRRHHLADELGTGRRKQGSL